ncbi:MAG: hypothetical protein CLLPBCKN_008001 [Chroococcidiopsis cubana SAG 39.79]|nr:AbrB family transcriptional regulator [Chroococcidiopsis cubana]MDZ4878566.1 hypothetical protein [Chroococcidiopsis cubana SAG 39.79]
MMKFLNALIDAEGIELDSTSNSNGRGGRSASYRISVQSNGNLLIGSAYTKQMGLQQGDEFVITLGKTHSSQANRWSKRRRRGYSLRFRGRDRIQIDLLFRQTSSSILSAANSTSSFARKALLRVAELVSHPKVKLAGEKLSCSTCKSAITLLSYLGGYLSSSHWRNAA